MKQPSNNPDNKVEIDAQRQEAAQFERYLQKDSPLSQQYQAIPTPEPSEKINQSILAAAQKQASKNHWWYRPSSWAATIAIVSLAGLLSHNLWLTEQENLKQEMELPSISAPEPASLSEPKRESIGATQRTPVASSAAKPQPSSTQPAKRASSAAEGKDSRGLRFKSASAPVMPSASASLSSLPSEPPSENIRLNEDDVRAIQTVTSVRSGKQIMDIPENKEKLSDTLQQDMKQPLTAPQWLDEIKQLIQYGQYEKARQQLNQFRKNHPEYPIDPIIIEQLSP